MTDRWQRTGAGVIEAGWLACVVGVPLTMSLLLALTFTADKVLTFRMLTELLAVVGLLLWMRRPGVRPTALLVAVAAYGLVMVLATVGGRNLIQGFWGSYMRLFGLFTLLHGGVLFVLVASYFRTERQWHRLLAAIGVVSLFICGHALLQWRGHEDAVMGLLFGRQGFRWSGGGDETYRPFATLGNSSYLGTFLLFAITFTLGALLTLPRGRRWPVAGLLGLLVWVLAINQTRGAWLAVAATGFTFALFNLPAPRRRWLVGGTVAIALAVGVLGMVAARNVKAGWVTSNPILVRLAYFGQRDRNTSGWYRLDMWRRVGADVAATPASLLLGYGPESYQAVSSRSFVPAYADGSEGAQFMDSTHNVFLDTLVEGGVLGLVAFLGVLVVGFLTGLRALRRGPSPTQRVVLITALSALVGYTVQGLFLFNHVVTLLFLCLTLGLIAAASRAEWGAEPEAATAARPRRATIHAPVTAPAVASGKTGPRWYGPAVAALGIAVLIGVALPVNARMYRAQILKRQAERAGAAGRVSEATVALGEACRLVPFERTYHVDLANCLAGEASLDDGPAAMVEAFRAAERELRRAVALDPGDIRTYWPLGLLYRFWGSLDPTKFAAAEEVYRRAAAMSPRRQRTYWAWGDLLLEQGQREAALAKYRHALAIDPSVAASHRALARLHLQLREPEQAEPLYERAWQTPGVLIPPTERAAEQEALGLAFLARGRTEKARAYLTGALELDPTLDRARAALEQLPRQAAGGSQTAVEPG